ncbi:hypothetical protein DFJ73DRAFT_573595 [Zopfochytrium polystomum]|nr:hypothetical protein DFJ73DRAFT_573595 [Zopfochytrium polystomum]
MSIATLSSPWSYFRLLRRRVDRDGCSLSAVSCRRRSDQPGVRQRVRRPGLPRRTEYYGECYCGTSLPKTKAANATAECSFPCKADSSQICGGSLHLTVYKGGSTFSPSAPIIANFASRGCYVDALNPRSFNYTSSVSGKATTNQACTAECVSKGYAFAGTEHFGECYCSNSVVGLSKSSNCAMPCLGDVHQVCGDNALLTVFQSTINPTISGWDYKGCYVDAQQPTRSLPVSAGSNLQQRSMCRSLFSSRLSARWNRVLRRVLLRQRPPRQSHL